MIELYPYYTNDGSVGLYSKDANDIYHSTYGALTEAYEKFILPIKEIILSKNEIKVLDICYGIGYNTKCIINEILCNYAIGSDNIKYNDKLHTDKIYPKIFVHAIDNDKIISLLSPFFITGKKIKNNKLSFKNNNIEKLLSKQTKPTIEIKKEINLILLKELINSIDDEIIKIITDKKYDKYFDKHIVDFCLFYKKWGYKNTLYSKLNAFLHNIYYKYISWRNKISNNCYKLDNFTFNINFKDAREVIKNDNNLYDIVFLDAFTPAKCPCLWTIDFFKELYKHLKDDGVILTYSNSAQVRNAFLNAGFYIGKIFSPSQKKFTGTIAVKNKSLIKYELSEFDLGLLKTRAGIFYRDENLSLDNGAIIEAHNLEVKNSMLVSSTKYINNFNKDKNYEKV